MPKPRRTWSGTGCHRRVFVETVGSDGLWYPRGTIRAGQLQDVADQFTAAQTRWLPQTPDHVWLDPVVGDYTTAEQALLDATKELEI